LLQFGTMGFGAVARFGTTCGGVALCVSTLSCRSIPNGRAAVDDVRFRGVREVSKSDLSKKIATAPSPKFLGLFAGFVYDYELFDPFVLQKDLERVERYYRARGFYQARARAGRVVYTAPNHVRVYVVVEEGPPVLIGDVRVEGIEQLPENVQQDVLDAVRLGGMRRGARFDEDQFAGTQWHVERALQDDAYAYARVERSARVDLPYDTAQVVFRVSPDQPSTIGKITVEGLGSLPTEPILRALDLTEGERYSATELDHAQQALLDLGVFSSAVVTPERSDPPPPDRAVPITVRVTPTKLRTVRLGGGFELDVIKTNVHLLAGWSNSNLFGGLRRFDVDFRPGLALYPTRIPTLQAPTDFLPEEKLRTQLTQPGVIEARTHGYLRGELNIYPLLLTSTPPPDAPVIGYREARAAIGANRALWKFYADLSYNLQLNSPFAYVGTLDPELRTVLTSYVDLLTTLDFRDDPIEPHTGVYLLNDLQLAGGPLEGQAQDFRLQPEARAYVPVSHATLALRAMTGLLLPANFGGSLGLAPPGETPPGVERETYVRDLQLVYFRGFFSGGPGSNRGYPLYGVGPHGPVPFLLPNITQQIKTGCVPGALRYKPSENPSCLQPLGGLTMWATSAELRFPLSADLTEATFCDASDVEVGRVQYVLNPHLSCGLGLRYKTPVGPIRLDIAYRIPGLNPAPGDPDYPGDVLGLPIGVAFGIGEAY
jgi:outer membrane protein insertion porin family/translocation and assembly module TamA